MKILSLRGRQPKSHLPQPQTNTPENFRTLVEEVLSQREEVDHLRKVLFELLQCLQDSKHKWDT